MKFSLSVTKRFLILAICLLTFSSFFLNPPLAQSATIDQEVIDFSSEILDYNDIAKYDLAEKTYDNITDYEIKNVNFNLDKTKTTFIVSYDSLTKKSPGLNNTQKYVTSYTVAVEELFKIKNGYFPLFLLSKNEQKYLERIYTLMAENLKNLNENVNGKEGFKNILDEAKEKRQKKFLVATENRKIDTRVALFIQEINDYKNITKYKDTGGLYNLGVFKDEEIKAVNAGLNEVLESFYNTYHTSTSAESIKKNRESYGVAVKHLAKLITNLEKENIKKYLEKIYEIMEEKFKSLEGAGNSEKKVKEIDDSTRDDRREEIAGEEQKKINPDCVSFSDFYKNACDFGDLVSLMISGVVGFVNKFVADVRFVISELFNLSIIAGVYNFSSWTGGESGPAYQTWKMILGLVVSLILPFILFLLIKQVIKNDDSFKKILPGILMTAVFVYFSFSIVGFLIDQANIITIYIYRALTGSNAGTISSAMDAVFAAYFKTNKDGVDVLLFNISQLVINISITFVLIQASILMIFRGVVLLLSLVFSPIMMIPVTGLKMLDEFKGKIFETFWKNLISAPIFIFLIIIALKVGTTARIFGEELAKGEVRFFMGIIQAVLVIGLIQFAISLTKSLSGEFSNKITSMGSSWIGRQTFGRLGQFGRGVINQGHKVPGLKWITGKPGSAKHQFWTNRADNIGNMMKKFEKPGSLKDSTKFLTEEYNPKSAAEAKIKAEVDYHKNLKNITSKKELLEAQNRNRNRLKEGSGFFRALTPKSMKGLLSSNAGALIGEITHPQEEINKKILDQIKGTVEKFDFGHEDFKSAQKEEDKEKQEKDFKKLFDKHGEKYDNAKTEFSKYLEENKGAKERFKSALKMPTTNEGGQKAQKEEMMHVLKGFDKAMVKKTFGEDEDEEEEKDKDKKKETQKTQQPVVTTPSVEPTDSPTKGKENTVWETEATRQARESVALFKEKEKLRKRVL